MPDVHVWGNTCLAGFEQDTLTPFRRQTLPNEHRGVLTGLSRTLKTLNAGLFGEFVRVFGKLNVVNLAARSSPQNEIEPPLQLSGR